MNFNQVLAKYRKIAFSERDKGDRFERLMQNYLQTDPKYAYRFKKVWKWCDFPGRRDLGGGDTGIDLVAVTHEGDYWAIQCKCFQENTTIDKPAVDSFLSTSSRQFKNEQLQTVGFTQRLWISTTNHWGPNATGAITNQFPSVIRLNLHDLQESSVDWEKLDQGISGEHSRTEKYPLKQHQRTALDKTHEHFKTADRGKLIMACGTGKTFNSLRIAERETNGKGFILFLVPSIALLSQSLREWSAHAIEPINAICICSDPEVSRKKVKNDDSDFLSVIDLALPASTNVNDIIKQFRHIPITDKGGMTVVFSTYQSINVIAKAQQELIKEKNAFSEFDLIICDEAHRTTGVTLSGDEESAFTKVHDNDFIKGKKRLYMTATPRLYSDDSKSRAAQAEAILCSMDDVSYFGEEIYRIGFGEAVEKDLLSDYKVLILTLSEADVPPAVQKMLKNSESEISTDDASKLIGCVNALSKQILGDAGVIKDSDPDPMRRAVAFCPKIDASKTITQILNTATDVYIDSLPIDKREKMVSVASKHIDGTMTAPQRDERLSWLKEETENNECRILTNVRCLSEGVDVPSLDAVMFLSARNSQVDVVQSVGRVMRKAPGKKYGYIIIPIVVPSDIEPDVALNDNERYRVVWTVLNALRAHDDRFNATINRIELNRKRPNNILIGRPDNFTSDGGETLAAEGPSAYGKGSKISQQLAMQFEQLQSVVFARMVQKVGDRRYWEQWAKNVAEIAERQVERIKRITSEKGEHKKAFENFLKGLQKNINPSITQQEAIEMLSQHIITKPVFEALFEGYSFVKNNPISVSMQAMLDLLEEQAIEKDTETLQRFYDSVKMRAADIDNAEGKQRIIVELYDKFFKTAFPKMVERLGIVYTPVEVVDFIIHSVADVLEKEFGRSISDENIHILEPFAGTGTFITRLLQSGRIKLKDLPRKYKHEIHANEIVLLAYYIAAVNIENTYHDIVKANEYEPFDGICLTDTFQLGETEDGEKLFSEMFPQNSARVQRQQKAPLRVIIGNPPYSIGQKSANDDAKNQEYPKLNSKIANTYAKASNAVLSKSLYDAYIKAFRWSTDRLESNGGGVIAFITNSGWIEKNSLDGFRKSLEREFSSVYVFNLRGSVRGRSGEAARKEGQSIFEILAGTAITILVKKPEVTNRISIYYNDIGEYLGRREKLEIIKRYKTLKNIDWDILNPNQFGDWITQRNNAFEQFIPIDPSKKYDTRTNSFFITQSLGVATNRDNWVYNFSKKNLKENITNTINHYNDQRLLINNGKLIEPERLVTKGNWTRDWLNQVKKNVQIRENASEYRVGLYRPFTKSNYYFDDNLNQERYQLPKLFPSFSSDNKLICLTGTGSRQTFSTIITDNIPSLDLVEKAQCFPLYYYEERQKQKPSLFDTEGESEYIRREGISDFILENAKKRYGKNLNKEDVFYYVYGFLHSPEYRILFTSDLNKMLPRLPLVEDVRDFWTFSKAGRVLAELHINYESVTAYEGVQVTGANSGFYTVEKMRFPKKEQKDTINYNSRITISNIPAKAYEYVVNGKSAIEWIVERYQITTHKESGITNNPNDWSEKVGNPRYILDLLLSIINVSIQTVDIVAGLPKLDFATQTEVEQTEPSITLTPNPEIVRPNTAYDGIYSIQDVVRITQLSRSKISSWFDRLSTEGYEGIQKDYRTHGQPLLLNFYGVHELMVIQDLRDKNKIPLKDILDARKWLQEKFGKPYPYATRYVLNTIAKAGKSIIFKDESSGDYITLGKGNAQLNLAFIKEILERIEFDEEMVGRLYLSDTKLIAIDPKLGGGRPCTVVNEVWIEMIKSMFEDSKSTTYVSQQYEISEAAVNDALKFEKAVVLN